jgi:lysozyme family protein
MSDFSIALKRTLNFEGGYSNVPGDHGGETNFGIMKETAVMAGYTGPMKEIPMDIVEKIYLKDYWIPLSCALFNSQELSNHVFDAGVNMGIGKSEKMLQQAVLNTGDEITVDGQIGSQTILAVNYLINMAKETLLINNFRDIRRGHYRGIVANNPSQAKFLNGWLSRC